MLVDGDHNTSYMLMVPPHTPAGDNFILTWMPSAS